MADIQIKNEHPEGAYGVRILRARAREFLEKLGKGDVELSILLTTDPGIQELNRRFRRKNRPTDVLSFPAGNEEPLLPGFPIPLGDLAISLDTARRRASEDGRSLAFELSRYLAHGLLHLLGYDHEVSEREARRMARKEAELLGVPGMLADAQGVGPKPSRASRTGVEKGSKGSRETGRGR
ncbi:rRNA maturation RNase YbeY [Vulgatibacter incomptus]|uniref:Endoribonuclease YbeY n=1 Tax=Vulgatibacter incomptus TaxID=1391653 RepID=A0A0K1PAN3_9BACT|nr:rRNA maturation RNase YbeY [Vulgatibacter incomptus]AKU90598.1 Metal-dependent hydrolase YbeY [Vulgatibacter incomptus]